MASSGQRGATASPASSRRSSWATASTSSAEPPAAWRPTTEAAAWVSRQPRVCWPISVDLPVVEAQIDGHAIAAERVVAGDRDVGRVAACRAHGAALASARIASL